MNILKRFSSIIALVIVIILLLLPQLRNHEKNKSQAVIDAFANSQAEILSTRVICEGIVKKNKIDLNNLQKFSNSILASFDVSEEYTEFGQNVSDHYKEYFITAKTKDNSTLKVTILCEEKDLLESNSLMFEYVHDGLSKMQNISYIIRNSMEPYVSLVNTNSSITGTYIGKLNTQQIDQIKDVSIKKQNADLKFFSRYSEYEDKTYITLTNDQTN